MVYHNMAIRSNYAVFGGLVAGSTTCFLQLGWMHIKLAFVFGLYLYHFSLHSILASSKGIFKQSSTQLRIWNEVATIFLFAIVFLVVVRTNLSF